MKSLYSLFLLVSASALLMPSCTNSNSGNSENTVEEEVIATEIDSTDLSSLDWDVEDRPLFIISTGNTLAHIFESSEDSAICAPNAARYTTLINNGKCEKIVFDQIHDGQTTGYLICGKYSSHMRGIYYKGTTGALDQEGGFAFTDAFMANHENIQFKSFDGAKAPNSIIEKARKRYDGKIDHSWKCAESLDKSIGVYRLQFQPNDSVCMGMLVVVDGDSLYTLEDKAYDYEGNYTWHVDDEGIYGPIRVLAITRGEKGLDIFSVDYACESTTPEAFVARNGKLEKFGFGSYYNYIDYHPQPIAVNLPANAKLKAELEGYKVWVDEEICPSEDNPMGQYSVYYQKPESGEYYRIASNSNPEASEKLISNAQNWPMYVEKNELLSCSDVYLTKNPRGDIYLILEGCPDARNTFTYAITLPVWEEDQMLRWIPTNSGYRGLDASGELLCVANYGYNDEGRYSVIRYYDFSFELVRETPCEE